MERINLGIIGCGEVSQINHLPSLQQLDRFEVVALADVSETVRQGVGERYNVPARYADYRELLAREDIGAVLIATPHAYHAEQALAAIAAGKHVLVEKPLCLTLEDAEAIVAAQERAGVVVQVGYMRRYASAFLEACARLNESNAPIRLARVHDVIGENKLIVAPTSRVIRGDDVPARLQEEGRERMKRQILAAIGPADETLARAYGLLLGLSTHDISAMRELLGRPQDVLYASARHGGRYVSAAFDYGSFVCQFETGVDSLARMDAHLEVYTDKEVLLVRFDTPYVRHLPVRLELLTPAPGGGTVRQAHHPAWEDAFTSEWRSFYSSITGGKAVKTHPADAREDLHIFLKMIARMRGEAMT